jgi:hypothetical protein
MSKVGIGDVVPLVTEQEENLSVLSDAQTYFLGKHEIDSVWCHNLQYFSFYNASKLSQEALSSIGPHWSQGTHRH